MSTGRLLDDEPAPDTPRDPDPEGTARRLEDAELRGSVDILQGSIGLVWIELRRLNGRLDAMNEKLDRILTVITPDTTQRTE